jgi:hypothetical protein
MLLLLVALAAMSSAPDPDRPAHRAEFTMNGISGGDFRQYITDAVAEDDLWARAMRTFGTFHNHMHEVMTAFARYDAEELGHPARVPEIGARLSGGEWTEYRENLEAEGDESTWRDFVQVFEVLHDRVHHAMVHAVFYDHATRGRTVDLGDYIGDRAPHPAAETIPTRDTLHMRYVAQEDFRRQVWHEDRGGDRWHAARQAMLVFDEVLYDLMNRWAAYGATLDAPACHPPAYGEWMTGTDWRAYADGVEACPQAEWRDFVRVVGLMHDRIHDALYWMVRHEEAAHG